MTDHVMSLKTYQVKCRFCLDHFKNEEIVTSIDNNIENLFLDLTKTKLKTSQLLSSQLCSSCSLQFINVKQFKELLVDRQNYLIKLLEEKLDDSSCGDEVKVEYFEPESSLKVEQDFMTILDSQHIEENTVEDNLQRKQKKRKHRTADEYHDNTCPLCRKKFTEKRKIPLHIKRVHTKIRDFHCKLCDYSAYTRFDVARHVKNIHEPQTENPSDKRICPDCGKTVRGNNQLTLHIRKKHLMIKKFKCDLCPFASYGKYEIRSHLEHIHIPKEFKECHACSLCSSILSSAMGLKVHMQHKHSGLRPHSCFCGKTFSLRETLKTHIKNVHKGERKFACQFCSKRFGQAVRLKDHINNNHGIKQEIPCTQCSKIFHSTRNLKAHLVYHDEPKFNCFHCGKKFFLTNKLKEHLKTHEGAEHSCRMCSRSFQLLSSLKRHMKSHDM